MTRNDFMNRLKSLLQEMPENERDEALQYYNDYFDDAGVDNEAEVLESLGSPEQVAASIKADIMGMNSGEFTEKGYKGVDLNKNLVSVVDLSKNDGAGNSGSDDNSRNNCNQNNANYNTQNNNKQNDPNTKKDDTNTILIIIICILASPVILSVLSAAIGVLTGIAGAAVAVVISLMASAIGLALAAIVCLIIGVTLLFKGAVVGGVLLGGIALLLAALALLGLWLMVGSIYLLKLAVPYINKGWNAAWNWVKGLFKKGDKA